MKITPTKIVLFLVVLGLIGLAIKNHQSTSPTTVTAEPKATTASGPKASEAYAVSNDSTANKNTLETDKDHTATQTDTIKDFKERLANLNKTTAERNSWADEIKGNTNRGCHNAKKAYTELNTFISELDDSNITLEDIGTTKDKIETLKKTKALAYATTVITSLRKNQDFYDENDTWQSPLDVVDDMIDILTDNELTIEKVGSSSREIRTLLLQQCPHLIRKWRAGSSEAGDALLAYIESYRFIGPQLGLSSCDENKLRGNDCETEDSGASDADNQ